MGQSQSEIKWYFKPSAVVIALLCVGPLALPLVWMSPAFKKIHKVAITLLVIVLTIWLAKASADLYNLLLKRIEELKKVLNL